MALRKTYSMWSKRIKKEKFQTKDLSVNNHSKYTQFR